MPSPTCPYCGLPIVEDGYVRRGGRLWHPGCADDRAEAEYEIAADLAFEARFVPDGGDPED